MTNLKRFSILLIAAFYIFTNVAPAIAASAIQEERFRVQFSNRTGQIVTISLSGPETITLTLSATISTRVSLLPGTYKYSYEACDRTFSGKVKVNDDQRDYVHIQTLLVLQKCRSKDSKSGGAAISFLIENNTGGSISFVFTGPKTYKITVPPGKTKIEMISGKYSFSATGNGCDGRWDDTGKINVRTGYYWRWFCEE
jgi:hypothetical protein